jgi:hypothetical protein
MGIVATAPCTTASNRRPKGRPGGKPDGGGDVSGDRLQTRPRA